MKTPQTIVAFGDSITEGVIGIQPEENWLRIFGSLLRENFPETDFQLTNAGVGGNSLREAMLRYKDEVLSRNPDWIFAEFGGNNHDPFTPERRVPDEEFLQHLERFHQEIPVGCKVCAITFPPVIDDRHAYGHHPVFSTCGGLNAAADMHRKIFRAFALAQGYEVLDLYQEILSAMERNGDHYILPDGVHLNAEGNRLLAEKLFEKIRDKL